MMIMMNLFHIRTFLTQTVAAVVLFSAASAAVSAQDLDRKDVRSGNRHFSKEEYKEAIVDYQKALLRDSTSFAASYNLANALYRMGNFTEARSVLDTISGRAPESGHEADYHYNAGNTALSLKNYQAAVDSYKAALLRNPGDTDAKENYIYARKKLEDQQNNQGKDNQNQNQNQDQNQDQDRNDQDNRDKSGEDNQDSQDNRDGQGDNVDGDRNQGQSPQEQPAISRQAAQQMLNAIMAKEKETQDKVKKEKAAVMKSRQKEKNW